MITFNDEQWNGREPSEPNEHDCFENIHCQESADKVAHFGLDEIVLEAAGLVSAVEEEGGHQDGNVGRNYYGVEDGPGAERLEGKQDDARQDYGRGAEEDEDR